MNVPEMRLKNFKVLGLFGDIDYEIPVNLDERVTAIIAPNGSGKTLCLRLISAFFEKKWSVILGVEFRHIIFEFSNSKAVVITKHEPLISEGQNETHRRTIEIRIYGREGDVISRWVPRVITDRRKSSIERYLPFLTRMGESRWRHDHTGEIYDLQEAVEAYGELLPESIRSGLWGDIPEELSEITEKIECRLIETQRLLVIKDEIEDRYYRHSSERRSTLAITEKAQSLKNIISAEINSYAAYSQSLDRSFPRRVILHEMQSDPANLAAKLLDLDEKRAELMAAGILNKEADEPVGLPTGRLDFAVARVLQMYAVDTQRKLETLDPLLSRINLFKKLIGQRFTTKNVMIDREHGIYVKSSSGEITLDKLSSGEQHQLVLFFELLFEIKKNSLILIDEPELSLHVAWQKKFISDLKSIIRLNSFDVILATHSPQLISHWEDLVVELGDVFESPIDDEFGIEF